MGKRLGGNHTGRHSNWPGGYNGSVKRRPRVFTGSLVSTLSPTIVNEFRFGSRKNWNYSWSSIWRPDEVGDEARKALPTHGSVSFFPTQPLFPDTSLPRLAARRHVDRRVRYGHFSDTLSWTKGKHAFKGGYELRTTSSRGWNGSDNTDWYKFPIVAVGQERQR